MQAWANFKGKLNDGDGDSPASWKTRLRCALNKSTEFQEVAERAQLDISEPYKVYRLVPPQEQGETLQRHLLPAAFNHTPAFLFFFLLLTSAGKFFPCNYKKPILPHLVFTINNASHEQSTPGGGDFLTNELQKCD